MEDKTTKRIIMILAVLVLCFCSHAPAEELTDQPEINAPSRTEEQTPNENASQDVLTIAPIIPDEAQPDTNPSEPAADENTLPEAETPEAHSEENIPEETAAPEENEAGKPDADTKEEESQTSDGEAVQPEEDKPSSGQSDGQDADEAHVWSVVREEPTCSREGIAHYTCALCGETYDEVLPRLEHEWSGWEESFDPSLPACEGGQVRIRRCLACGLEETETVAAPAHQWEAVSYTEATCTQDGEAVRRCVICGAEETIVLPAYGHTYVETTGEESSNGQLVCALCGDVKAETTSAKSHIYYNNTVTSFGPTTRELIGGSVWNRVTPVDLSQEGVFTYPLVASNMYTVGTATVVNEEDVQEINYKLSSSKIYVHSESLVVYPSLEALKTGENAVSFDFNSPIDLKGRFGEDAHVIVAITLKADYDADSTGVRYFSADQSLIEQMVEMIK